MLLLNNDIKHLILGSQTSCMVPERIVKKIKLEITSLQYEFYKTRFFNKIFQGTR